MPGTFEIESTNSHVYWAEARDGQVVVHRRQRSGEAADEILLRWSSEVLRNLLLWAEGEKSVTFSFTGPMAHQIRKLSQELSLTPEMFVWHAVKVFIETSPEG